MFTNNCIAFQHNVFFNTYRSTVLSGGTYGKDFKAVYGANVQALNDDTFDLNIGYAMQYISLAALPTSDTSVGSSGLRVGSGSTPATREDYTLESQITSGIRFINTSSPPLFESDKNGVYSVATSFGAENTTEEEITIREIGLFSNIKTGTSSYAMIMLERTVLASPITISAGEAKVITYKITFNQTQ